ncbi:MAG: acetyl-CoA hydrolase/transferase C-terminal domain-containing protein [Dehalococcoidia bacterium]|nr:acetyl-CoA hydrolase/transferase C-terminal domain-containing protein [Dehalococcoidia bacterium]
MANWMSWEEEYKRKLVSAEQAASVVKSGNFVSFTSGREPHAIGLAIASRLGELKSVVVNAPTPGYDFGWYEEGWQDSFQVIIGMPTATCQEAIDTGRVDQSVYGLIPLDRPPGNRQPDVLITEVSPPDRNGFCSFGASCWNKKEEIRNAKIAIAEVNPSLIRPCGEDNYIHISEIDYFVEHRATGGVPGMGTLAGRAIKAPEPYLSKICGYVNEILKDGDTIQIGIGRTTEPLVKMGMLNGKQDIGYHSEATPPGIITLIQQGVINGKRKTLHPDLAVVTSIGGSTRAEMEWVDNNPLIRLVTVSYLEDVRTIAAHDNIVAINNALMVDIHGQIVADSLGPRVMSAAGGQIPFVIGAHLSKGGHAITVLPSTAVNGTVSRIVVALPEHTTVTIQKNLADIIITEYGVARLKGKTRKQRIDALINIAHPHFRADLRKQVRQLL